MKKSPSPRLHPQKFCCPLHIPCPFYNPRFARPGEAQCTSDIQVDSAYVNMYQYLYSSHFDMTDATWQDKWDMAFRTFLPLVAKFLLLHSSRNWLTQRSSSLLSLLSQTLSKTSSMWRLSRILTSAWMLGQNHLTELLDPSALTSWYNLWGDGKFRIIYLCYKFI